MSFIYSHYTSTLFINIIYIHMTLYIFYYFVLAILFKPIFVFVKSDAHVLTQLNVLVFVNYVPTFQGNKTYLS